MAWTGPSEEILVLNRIIMQNSECIFQNAEGAMRSCFINSLLSVVVIMINSASYSIVLNSLSLFYV